MALLGFGEITMTVEIKIDMRISMEDSPGGLGMLLFSLMECINSEEAGEPFFNASLDPHRIVSEAHAIEVWPCGCITVLGNYCRW